MKCQSKHNYCIKAVSNSIFKCTSLHINQILDFSYPYLRLIIRTLHTIYVSIVFCM